MSLHSLHYPMSSSFDDQIRQSYGVSVCVCVYTSGMDWHREGWTGEGYSI